MAREKQFGGWLALVVPLQSAFIFADDQDL